MPLHGGGYNKLGAVAPFALLEAGLCKEFNDSTSTTKYYDIFTDSKFHDVKAAETTFSIVQADSEFYFFGWNPLCDDTHSPEKRPEWHRIACDSHSNLHELDLRFSGHSLEDLCAISKEGELFWFSMDNKQCKLVLSWCAEELKGVMVTHIATRQWSPCVAVAFRHRSQENLPMFPTWHLHEFDTIRSVKEWFETGRKKSGTVEQKGHGTVKDLAAGSSAFVMLLSSGDMLNWGVSTRSWELGVSPEEKHPAETPRLMDALAGIPIKKVVGFYDLYCAVSGYNDLYLWGRPSDYWRVTPLRLDEYNQLVNIVDLGDNVNVMDVGIGGNSLVCVADDGRVFGWGQNTDGQLFTTNQELVFNSWKELPGMKASKVACSFWTTFLW